MSLNITLILWVFFSSLIAFYLGGLLAGRLTGIPDRAVGMLHRIAVWSSAVVVSVLLGTLGVGGVINSAMNAVKGTTVMGGSSTYSEMTEGRSATRVPGYLNPLIANLKREIGISIANTTNRVTPGENISSRSVHQAIDQIDRQTLVAIAVSLVKGNTEQAKDLIANSTST